MHDVQPGGNLPALGHDQLYLTYILLQLRELTLQQHPAVVYEADVVAHVLKLAQVVRRDEYANTVLSHVGEQQRPDLTAHYGVQAVDRLVQYKQLRPHGEGQPEGGLLLHASRKAPYRHLAVYGEGFGQAFEALGVEAREHAFVKAHHVVDVGLREVEHFVGDVGHARLDSGIFKHRLPVGKHLPAVCAQYARYVAYGGCFARSVRPYQPVDRAGGYVHVQSVQGLMSAEALFYPDKFNYHRAPPSHLSCP